MKIALIKPPGTYADWYKQPALGIAYLSACVQARGFECRIFDAYFHSWSQAELLSRIRAYAPDMIGLTAMTHEISRAAEIATGIKTQMDVPAVIGGCHATAIPEKTLTEFEVFDYAVHGEGEQTIIELLNYVANRNDALAPDQIDGLSYRDQERVVVNKLRSFIEVEELDVLPYPALEHYCGESSKALSGADAYYVMFTSRGCPYNCAFCMQVLGRKVRRRSSESIIKEMEHAIECYGAHTFNFADEIFLFDNERTRELLKLFIERNFPKRIKWSALTRANFVNSELINLAKAAGCVRLEMGVESGDDRILENISKGITVDMVEKAVSIIKNAGISLATYYILGHPGETIETVKKTVDLAVRLNTDTIAVGLMVPYPGTRIFDLASQGKEGYRLLSKDWAEYDKYGGKVLEIQGLSYRQLTRWQKRALLLLYLRNRRVRDCFHFFWKRRRALYFTARKKLIRLLKKVFLRGSQPASG